MAIVGPIKSLPADHYLFSEGWTLVFPIRPPTSERRGVFPKDGGASQKSEEEQEEDESGTRPGNRRSAVWVPDTGGVYVGIDVGANRLHCVAIDRDRRLVDSWLFDPSELDGLTRAVADATVIAVDAPLQLSTAPHRTDERLSRKFRPGRCAEIALGRDHGYWVPWVTPTEMPERGWIRTGLDLQHSLAHSGKRTIEVYPYAGYRALNGGGPIPNKQTVAGIRTRAALLKACGIHEPHLVMWSHDALDALLAAIIAHDADDGTATAAGCAHDDSTIYLPRRITPHHS